MSLTITVMHGLGESFYSNQSV